MTPPPTVGLTLQLTLYGLPKDTDLEGLTRLARDVAASLEEMGVFGQREFEPVHVFRIGEVKNP